MVRNNLSLFNCKVSFGLDDKDVDVRMPQGNPSKNEGKPSRGMGLVLDHGLDDRDSDINMYGISGNGQSSNAYVNQQMEETSQFGGR